MPLAAAGTSGGLRPNTFDPGYQMKIGREWQSLLHQEDRVFLFLLLWNSAAG
jgi:hypothetical protein